MVTTYATPREEVWSYSIQLDTSGRGGSLQYSGQISLTAGGDGYRDSVSDILRVMLNNYEKPKVSKSIYLYCNFSFGNGEIP